MQWLYEAFYSAIGELFADINDLGVEIFDLSWVQAVVSLFTMLGWSLFVVGVVVAVFEVAIESQSGRVNIKGTALNVLKGFFGASLVGALPVQLYKTCCTLQGIFTADLAGIYAGSQSSTIGAFAGQVLRLAFVPSEAVEVGLKIIFFLLAFAYCVIKIFFANIKRGGILLVQIAVGSLYLFSVPRGYTDGFYQWCKQVAAICLTAFLQTTLLFLGMMTFQNVSYDPPPLRWIFKRFIFSPFDRAQSDLLPTAPSIFSTPLLWVRYRILAGSEERCRWFFYNSLPKQKIIEKSRKISILYKAFTAFAYSIRAPPSEV